MEVQGAFAGHAPRTGRLRRFLGPLYFTGVFWYRLSLIAVRVLPEFLVPPVVAVFTTLFWLALGRVRGALGRNLSVVLGPCGRIERWRRTWRTLHAYAWCLYERYERFVPGRDWHSSMQNGDVWRALSVAPTGVVLSTAHVGSWEFASSLVTEAGQRELHLVREEELDPRAQRFVRELLERGAGRGYRTHFAVGDPSLGARLLEALREGAFVALQGDRARRSGRVHAARVFGRRMPFPIGPAALARSAGVPLVPLFAYRRGRRENVVWFGQPIQVAHSADKRADLARALDALGLEIEAAIRREPSQWFCFADAFLPEATDPAQARKGPPGRP